MILVYFEVILGCPVTSTTGEAPKLVFRCVRHGSTERESRRESTLVTSGIFQLIVSTGRKAFGDLCSVHLYAHMRLLFQAKKGRKWCFAAQIMDISVSSFVRKRK